MSVAYRAGHATIHGTTSMTEAVPGTVVAGDLLLAYVGWAGGTGQTIGSPSGWTQKGADVNNGTNCGARLLYKTAVSADIGSSVTFTNSGNAKSVTAIVAYSGAAGIGEFETATDSAATTHAAPALTSLHAGSTSYAVNFYTEKSSANTSWTPSGSSTSRLAAFNTGGGSESLLVSDSNAGTSTWAAQTATEASSSAAVMFSVEVLATSGISAPGTPTGVSAVAGNGAATVSFTPGATNGAPSVTYTATSSPGSFTGSGTASPVSVAGLTNGTAYTFTVVASSTGGSSSTSTASGSVTPTGGAVAFKGWGVPIVAAVKPTPPASAGTLVGIAPPSQTQDSWNSTGGFAGVTAMRYYSTGMPASWAASAGGGPAGPTQWLASVKPAVASTIADSNDAAITAWAKTVPSGTYVTAQHEPENKSKGISPTQFGQFFARFFSLAKAANSGLLVGPVMMTTTSNERASDSFGNIAGRNTWLEAVQANGVTPDFVGMDGYQGQGNGTNISDIFGQPTTVAQGLWPGVSMISAEWGYHTTGAADAVVNAWMINGYSWFNSNGYVAAFYWDGANFTLTNSGLTTLGGLS